MLRKSKIGWAAMLMALFAAGCKSGSGPEYRDGGVTIAYLKSLYARSPVTVEGYVYIAGRVVSTDQYGNFYKTLVVEDETGGIAIRIDLENYHRTYFRGMQIRIACNALVLSSYGGMLQLGAYSWEEGSPDPGYIAANRLAAVITVDSDKDQTPEPTPLGIPDLAPRHIGCFVAFEDVQFADPETGLTWSGAEADTDRHVIDRNGNRLIVRTSRFALFAGRTLPHGSGYIEGVMTYFNGKYQLVVCSDTYAVMEKPRFVVAGRV